MGRITGWDTGPREDVPSYVREAPPNNLGGHIRADTGTNAWAVRGHSSREAPTPSYDEREGHSGSNAPTRLADLRM